MSTALPRIREDAERDRREELAGMDPEDLRAEISRMLREISTEAEFLTHLVDSRQRGLGFLTAEAAFARDEMHRKDHADQLARAAAGDPIGHGHTAAPGNIAVISADRHARDVLHRLSRSLVTYFARQGVCLLAARPTQTLAGNPTIADLTPRLRALVMELENRYVLVSIVTSIDAVVAQLREVLDGEDRTLLGGPCPWCQLDSLVIHWIRTGVREEFVVRCEKPARARHLDACVCPDPICECKFRPIDYRHRWYLHVPASSPHSWERLASLLRQDHTTNRKDHA